MKEFAVVRQVIEDLKHDEGFRPFPYKCPAGQVTIGYGRNLSTRGLSEREADLMLRNDVNEAILDLNRVLPEWRVILSPARQRAIINMMFNLGATRFASFKKMIQAIKEERFDKASYEMLDSKWARQVGARADRLAKMMLEG